MEKTVPTDEHQEALRLYSEEHVREAMFLLAQELSREKNAEG